MYIQGVPEKIGICLFIFLLKHQTYRDLWYHQDLYFILFIPNQHSSSIVTFFFSYSLIQPSRNKLSKKKSVANIQEKSSKKIKDESDSEVYGNLDASKTILLHGLESDFIEEQMSEDKDFRFNFRMSIKTEMQCELVATTSILIESL